jgi:hypothetical protein
MLSFAVFALLAPSCSPGFDPPSLVAALRILAVDADRPYAQGGDKVTMRMTVTDGLQDSLGNPRPIQILWLAGCVNPAGDQYFLCFEQLGKLLAPLAANGTLPPGDLVKLDMATPDEDGAPGAHQFTFTVPQDIVTSRPPPDEGPHYGIEYVFYAACAGQLAPRPLEKLGSVVPEFPLVCLDGDGNPQGPDSFVPGYTQIYSFADGRRNANPPTEGLTLDGVELAPTPQDAAIVPMCAVPEAERRQTGCAMPAITESCSEHALVATVPDVAEVIPGAADVNGELLREVVWVNYFADRGDIDSSVTLVSDARQGFLGDHSTSWIAPDKPGLVTFFAVTRDQRGGGSVRRGYVRVQ